MRKILNLVMIVVILVLCYNAYSSSKENGQSFWYNLGSKSKTLIEDGIEKGKGIALEVSEGYKNPNDSLQ